MFNKCAMTSLIKCLFFSLFVFISSNLFANKGDNGMVVKDALKTDISDHYQIVNDSIKDSISLQTLKLPPLNVLFENARNNPSIAILEKEKQLQKKILSKEKKAWMNFFDARASYYYGVTDNYGTQTDILTPIFYQYLGIEQNYWNVGGSINISLEELFDLKGKVNRQKINIEKAELTKEQAFDQLKQQIIHLYVTIETNIEILKGLLQNVALYKGITAEAEIDFRNRRSEISQFASAKSLENSAKEDVEKMRSNIKEQVLILEIISKTEIYPNSN